MCAAPAPATLLGSTWHLRGEAAKREQAPAKWEQPLGAGDVEACCGDPKRRLASCRKRARESRGTDALLETGDDEHRGTGERSGQLEGCLHPIVRGPGGSSERDRGLDRRRGGRLASASVRCGAGLRSAASGMDRIDGWERASEMKRFESLRGASEVNRGGPARDPLKVLEIGPLVCARAEESWCAICAGDPMWVDELRMAGASLEPMAQHLAKLPAASASKRLDELEVVEREQVEQALRVSGGMVDPGAEKHEQMTALQAAATRRTERLRVCLHASLGLRRHCCAPATRQAHQS